MKKYDCVIFTDNPDQSLVWRTLGAYSLANVLRNIGYNCLVIDHLHAFTTTEIENILKNSVSDQTKFVGFSVGFFANTEGTNIQFPGEDDTFGPMNINQSFCPQGKVFENFLISKIKQLNNECKIVIGGPQTVSHMISNKNIDYLVIGYAENSVVNLMRHLEDKEELKKSYKNIHGIRIIDDRDATSYEFSTCYMNWLPEDIGLSKVLPLEVSRGCIFNCKFCQFPLRNKKINDYTRTADSIYHELQTNYDQFGISTYTLIDDTFNDDDGKLDMFLSVVKRLTFQPIFWCYARLDLFMSKFERVEKMYNIGVRMMYLGIETLHRKAGMAVGKGMHAHQQIDLIQRIRKIYGNNLVMHSNFIVGLPHEPLDSIDHTCNLFLNGELPLHTTKFTGLKINKSKSWWQSEIDKDYEKYGYVEHLNQPGEVGIIPGFAIGNDFLLWKNDHMTFTTALEKANELNTQLFKSPNMHVIGTAIIALLNYDVFSFDQLKNTKLSEMDWELARKQKLKKMFLYKRYLNKLLTH